MNNRAHSTTSRPLPREALAYVGRFHPFGQNFEITKTLTPWVRPVNFIRLGIVSGQRDDNHANHNNRRRTQTIAPRAFTQ